MRILFLGPTYVGDAVVASGLLDHLARIDDRARITLVCGRPAMPVLESMPGIARVIPFVKRRAHMHWLDIWRSCVGTRWDWVIDLRASGIAYMLRARRRSVYTPKSENHGHRTERWAHIMGLDTLPRPHLHPTAVQTQKAADLIPPGSPVIGFGPTANWPGKIWPADRFAALADRLTRSDAPFTGARIAVFGIESDRPVVTPLLDAIPAERRIDLVGKTDLMTACAALSHCALFVGNDSGLLYMSVANDIPGVALVGPSLTLFGPASPPLVAPWARKTAVARTPISFEEFTSAPDYDYRTTETMMDTLSVASVEQVVLGLIDRLSRDPAGPTA